MDSIFGISRMREEARVLGQQAVTYEEDTLPPPSPPRTQLVERKAEIGGEPRMPGESDGERRKAAGCRRLLRELKPAAGA